MEVPAIGLAGARVSAQALLALGEEYLERGVEALSQLLAGAGLSRSLEALDEWVEGVGGR